MSDKRSQVLILDPPVDLVFKGPYTEVVTSTLTLRNPTNDPVIFKVKTTAPKQYCVRPNSGLLNSHEDAIISVMLQPFDHGSAEKSKHKFMVQTMLAPQKFKLENLDSVTALWNAHRASNIAWLGWREAGKSQLMDSKLRCVFLDSTGGLQDPTSSALSVSANEGALSNQATAEDIFKSVAAPSAPITTTTPKQEVVTSTQTVGSTPAHAGGTNISSKVSQSTAGSTPAHVGGPSISKEDMEKEAVESKVRMMQDRIDQLSSENIQLKSESNKLRQRIGLGPADRTSALSAITKRAGSLSLIAIIFILVAIVLGYLVGKWL